jgi:polyisoprenoid-binding protein YceI
MENAKWEIDPAHSEINFKVKHLMISTVTGNFKVFEGQAEGAEDFKSVENIEFKANADSVNTNNAQRDEHLKSDDFFNTEKHPFIQFNAQSFSPEEGKINGELTIRETTKPVSLDVDFGGVVVDPYGQTKSGMTLSGKINRKDFGLKWNGMTEAGGVVVSDEVKLNAEVQFIKQN